MTMHLQRGLTTLNTRKRKTPKLTLAKIAKYQTELNAYNKRMRQLNCHDMQMNIEEYIAYCHGNYKPKSNKSEFKSYEKNEPYRRTTEYIPSSPAKESFGGTAARKEPNVYTGDLIVGIGTMHKSNAVPIMRGTNDAKEIARMRRG